VICMRTECELFSEAEHFLGISLTMTVYQELNIYNQGNEAGGQQKAKSEN